MIALTVPALMQLLLNRQDFQAVSELYKKLLQLRADLPESTESDRSWSSWWYSTVECIKKRFWGTAEEKTLYGPKPGEQPIENVLDVD
jgi:hypothetical protein